MTHEHIDLAEISRSDDLIDRAAYRIYKGGILQLKHGVEELHLIREFERSHAVSEFAGRLVTKIELGGQELYAGDVKTMLEVFLEDEVADPAERVGNSDGEPRI